MRWSVIICTRDRAFLLAETLESLGQLSDPGEPYEVIIVDNGSSDHTRAVVEQATQASRVRLRYFLEPRGGLSAARNTGLREARGEYVAFTDDDVLVETRWLEAFARAFATHQVDLLGGPVMPRWGTERPAWLPSGRTRGEIWGAIGLFDYGDEPRPLAKPLGANMAFRRAPVLEVGGFREDLGRDKGSLKGQEVPELLERLWAAGGRGGWYVPDAVVHHWIPPERLTKRYFRRWFYWKGISRAAVRDRIYVHRQWRPVSEVRLLGGLPRALYREAAEALKRVATCALRNDKAGAFEAETRLWYATGYVRAVWFGDPSPTSGNRQPRVPADASPTSSARRA